MVAHRAGNDLVALRDAERLPVGLIEADLHLFRGRVEVRHHKTLGPLPVLWDKWELTPGWVPRLELHSLLAAARADTPLMLDLKGRDPRLVSALTDALGGRPVTVCSQSWSLLDALRGTRGIRVVHSVGGRARLTALLNGDAGRDLDGVSIHRRLLSRRVVDRLRALTDTVMTWPVATVEDARMLGGWGVAGVITERYDALAPALGEEPVVRAA